MLHQLVNVSQGTVLPQNVGNLTVDMA